MKLNNEGKDNFGMSSMDINFGTFRIDGINNSSCIRKVHLPASYKFRLSQQFPKRLIEFLFLTLLRNFLCQIFDKKIPKP